MFLDSFVDRRGDTVRISREQGSRFAKEIAGDFNPIHDEDARRFCVPGDLLFALVLNHYGLSAAMSFRFENMLAADTEFVLPPDEGDTLSLCDRSGDPYLVVERSGTRTTDSRTVEAFTRQYVAFSGYNFPHYLQPLMESEGVMFNPQRPFVIYDSMAFELTRSDLSRPQVSLSDSSLEVSGRRGTASLEFAIHDRDGHVGSGGKRLIIGGLQPYDGERMARIIEAYDERRAAYAGDDVAWG